MRKVIDGKLTVHVLQDGCTGVVPGHVYFDLREGAHLLEPEEVAPLILAHPSVVEVPGPDDVARDVRSYRRSLPWWSRWWWATARWLRRQTGHPGPGRPTSRTGRRRLHRRTP